MENKDIYKDKNYPYELREKRNGWKTIGITFIVLFILACLIIWAAVSQSVNSASYYQKNYVYNSCSSGQQFRCVDSDAPTTTCKAGEQVLCVDNRLQSGIVCNGNSVANCVPSDYAQWIKCGTGWKAACYQDTQEFMACNSGSTALCLDKTSWGYWTGTYFITCNAGQTASCVSK